VCALPAARVLAAPYVVVLGQVERPGRYQLVAPTTLTQLLAAAQLTPLAWESTITRTAWDGRKVRARVPLRSILAGEAPDVWLFPGDIVYVDERTF
jgi:protein involved in polysaccharide export with SLBB domain